MTSEPLSVEYLRDDDVDETLDRQLRTLLSVCFTKPGDEVFAEHRYYRQMPQHRWLVRDAAGVPIAHVAVHDKTIGTSAGQLPIAGIAEVCVHPDYRGRGLVKRMLAAAHEWMARRDYAFSVLFGNPAVYSSSGYRSISNELRMTDPATGEVTVAAQANAMIRPAKRSDWPAAQIDLHGLKF